MRRLRENAGLKLTALVAAVMIWVYAASDRTTMPTKRVIAEVQAIGMAPVDLDVRVSAESVAIEVSGPRQELDTLTDGAVKAIVDLATVTRKARTVAVTQLVPPSGYRLLTFPTQRRFVPIQVTPKVRRRMPVSIAMRAEAPAGKRYETPRVTPAYGDILGAEAEVSRVSTLSAQVDAASGNIRADVSLRALDADGVVVSTVYVEPAAAHIECDLTDIAASRSVVVSPQIEGLPAPPLTIAEVLVDPRTVTVSGMPAEVAALAAIDTAPVAVTGAKMDIVRQIPLRVPPNITVQGGRAFATITIRLRDPSKASP